MTAPLASADAVRTVALPLENDAPVDAPDVRYISPLLPLTLVPVAT